MNRISTSSRQIDKFGAGKDGFNPGNESTGVPATALNAAWFDGVQEELCNFIEDAGIALDANNRAQLLAAFNARLGTYLRASVAANLTAGFYAAPSAIAPVAGVATPNFATRNVFSIAVTAALTIANPAAMPVGGMAIIYATQNAGGGNALTLGSAYKISSGAWSTVGNAVNILYLTFDGGTTIDVAIAQRGA